MSNKDRTQSATFRIRSEFLADAVEDLQTIIDTVKERKGVFLSKEKMRSIVKARKKGYDTDVIMRLFRNGELLLFIKNDLSLKERMLNFAVAMAPKTTTIIGWSNEGDPKDAGRRYDLFSDGCFNSKGFAECYSHFGKAKSLGFIIK